MVDRLVFIVSFTALKAVAGEGGGVTMNTSNLHIEYISVILFTFLTDIFTVIISRPLVCYCMGVETDQKTEKRAHLPPREGGLIRIYKKTLFVRQKKKKTLMSRGSVLSRSNSDMIVGTSVLLLYTLGRTDDAR